MGLSVPVEWKRQRNPGCVAVWGRASAAEGLGVGLRGGEMPSEMARTTEARGAGCWDTGNRQGGRWWRQVRANATCPVGTYGRLASARPRGLAKVAWFCATSSGVGYQGRMVVRSEEQYDYPYKGRGLRHCPFHCPRSRTVPRTLPTPNALPNTYNSALIPVVTTPLATLLLVPALPHGMATNTQLDPAPKCTPHAPNCPCQQLHRHPPTCARSCTCMAASWASSAVHSSSRCACSTSSRCCDCRANSWKLRCSASASAKPNMINRQLCCSSRAVLCKAHCAFSLYDAYGTWEGKKHCFAYLGCRNLGVAVSLGRVNPLR